MYIICKFRKHVCCKEKSGVGGERFDLKKKHMIFHKKRFLSRTD